MALFGVLSLPGGKSEFIQVFQATSTAANLNALTTQRKRAKTTKKHVGRGISLVNPVSSRFTVEYCHP